MTTTLKTAILAAAIVGSVLVFPQIARADGNGSIVITQSSTGKGSVNADGTYTVAAGWDATTITLFAVPTNDR